MKRIKYCVALFLFSLLFLLPISAEALAPYGMLPIYGRDIIDGSYTIVLDTDHSLLTHALADISVKNGEIIAKLLPETRDITRITCHAQSSEPDADGIFTLSIPALDKEIPAVLSTVSGETDVILLFRADSLPKEALMIELPDYTLIEEAISSYSKTSTPKHHALTPSEPVVMNMPDGEYAVSVDLAGGSGKAFVSSPTILTIRDGKAYARLQWSSANYDYMIVGTEKYWNTSAEGVNSVFEIPISCFDSKMTVIADTTAMGTPHEVQYDLTFYENTIGSKSQLPQEAAKRVVIVASFIIIGGGMLNHLVKKKRRM